MAGGYLEVVRSFPQQIERALTVDLCPLPSPSGSFNKVMISGMGGSSIAGAILQSYMHESKIPVFVSRSYTLPEFIDSNTLVFVISYSGNTEETLSSIKTAYRKGATLIAIASGGKLIKQFHEKKAPYIQIPAGLQPRASLPFLLIPLLRVLAGLKLIDDPSREIAQAIASLRKIPYEEQAKTLASKLISKVPLIYASEVFASVAYRWKTQFNENSKIHAFTHSFAELNHNELVGYTNVNANYHVIILEDERDHKRIKSRMRLTRDIISKKDVPCTQILIKGDNMLTRLLSAIYMGDLTSVHLALLTNTDPEPVHIIEDFKEQLAKIPNI